MDEVKRIYYSAQVLFSLAGGNPANKNNFYFVLAGGGDDITGMCVNDAQLKNWQDLGAAGEQIQGLLKSYEGIQEKAFGYRCYNAETISRIVQEASSQNKSCLPACV